MCIHGLLISISRPCTILRALYYVVPDDDDVPQELDSDAEPLDDEPVLLSPLRDDAAVTVSLHRGTDLSLAFGGVVAINIWLPGKVVVASCCFPSRFCVFCECGWEWDDSLQWGEG